MGEGKVAKGEGLPDFSGSDETAFYINYQNYQLIGETTMLAVLEIKNISVNSSDNHLLGYAVFSQSEKGGLKENKIAIAAKGQVAAELVNYTRGIATGYLRFVKSETDEGNKITRVSLVVESFSPLEAANAPKNEQKKAAEPKTDEMGDEIPF